MFFSGALSSGHFSSPTDLAPNLAGTIFGMSNTLSGGLTAYLTAVTVGAITQDNYTFQAWTIVFSSAAVIYVVTSLACFFMISGDIQQWNYNESQHPSCRRLEDIEEYRNLLEEVEEID